MPVMGPIQSALVPAASMVSAQKYRAVVYVEPKKERPRWLERFLSDCRDLWSLITKGQPKDDPLLPWRMMAEIAKQPVFDVDAWEAEQWRLSQRKAFWFDPERYADTKYDWPRMKLADLAAPQRDYVSNRKWGDAQQALMSQSAASGMLQSAAMQAQINAMSQLQAFQNQQYMNGYDQFNRFDMDFGLKLR